MSAVAQSADICTAALVQKAPVFLNLRASLARAAELVAEASKLGANLVVFPETWLPGYPVWLDEAPSACLWDHPPAKALYRALADNALVLGSPEFAGLLELARKHRVHLVMGAHERNGGTLYNLLLLISPDGQYRIHRKLVPTYTERLVWGQGDGSTLGTLATPFGVLGGLICWEHWMPLARAAMHAQREFVHVAQWPTVRELHLLASRHYAFEGQCYVLAAGSVLTRAEVLEGFNSLPAFPEKEAARTLLEEIPGPDDRWLMRGGSAAIAPNAEYVLDPVYEASALRIAMLDPHLVTEGHLTLDTDGHYARPDVFELVVNRRAQANVQFRD